jgi:aspartyl protease family protein
VALGGGAGVRSGAREIVLAAGPGGHFLGRGASNGRPVHFMVDTGATVVALSRAEATRLRLDLSGARPVALSTANGVVAAQQLTLSAVTLGDVTVANVSAVIVPAPMPHVLLGNSFLQRFQMRRENDVMRLELR